MIDDLPVELDARRTAEGKLAADVRRNEIARFEATQEALEIHQKELEAHLFADPATRWREAAFKAQYLIRRYAETEEARDPRRQRLIERTLADLERLIQSETETK